MEKTAFEVWVSDLNPIKVDAVVGNISATGGIAADGNNTLGNSKSDINILRGYVRISDSFASPLTFGNNNASFDTNLYRIKANTLNTDSTFTCNALSGRNALSGADITLTNARIITPSSTTDSGQFLILNINGSEKAIRLWDFIT